MSTDGGVEGAHVVYLGPAGTFTHEAARTEFADAAELVAESTIPSVFARVAAGDAAYGVVPIENSTEGSVALTLDCLLGSALSIQREIVIEVEHCLVGRSAELGSYRTVASHPQALGQCRRFLERELCSAELLPMTSTAAAARAAQGDPTTAAIASRLAAELFELSVVAAAIQDRTPNVTRFVAIGHGDTAPTGHDRTSIVFSLPHQQGALLGALGVLDRAGINLTRIESRPLPGRLWEYSFFVDFEGHARDPAVAHALAALERVCGTVSVLGSFPRAF